ncbi:hypothetical protein Ddc_08554 [Ditylenchus destructor]|nr:hypothetical protein Ddc_08554 [Ditylenchus destructor]
MCSLVLQEILLSVFSVTVVPSNQSRWFVIFIAVQELAIVDVAHFSGSLVKAEETATSLSTYETSPTSDNSSTTQNPTSQPSTDKLIHMLLLSGADATSSTSDKSSTLQPSTDKPMLLLSGAEQPSTEQPAEEAKVWHTWFIISLIVNGVLLFVVIGLVVLFCINRRSGEEYSEA